MLNIDKRISKQELENIFGVDRATIENWRKNHGLPMIEISSHSKYIRIDDLIEWENKHKQMLITEQGVNTYIYTQIDRLYMEFGT